jgi:hypothetical protein
MMANASRYAFNTSTTTIRATGSGPTEMRAADGECRAAAFTQNR